MKSIPQIEFEKLPKGKQKELKDYSNRFACLCGNPTKGERFTCEACGMEVHECKGHDHVGDASAYNSTCVDCWGSIANSLYEGWEPDGSIGRELLKTNLKK